MQEHIKNDRIGNASWGLTTGDNINNFKWKNRLHHKIFKSLEKSGWLIKGINKTIKNETKTKKWIRYTMLIGILGASLLEDLLTDKVVKGKIPGPETYCWKNKYYKPWFSMMSTLLTNFKIAKSYQNEHKFKGV